MEMFTKMKRELNKKEDKMNNYLVTEKMTSSMGSSYEGHMIKIENEISEKTVMKKYGFGRTILNLQVHYDPFTGV